MTRLSNTRRNAVWIQGQFEFTLSNAEDGNWLWPCVRWLPVAQRRRLPGISNTHEVLQAERAPAALRRGDRHTEPPRLRFFRAANPERQRVELPLFSRPVCRSPWRECLEAAVFLDLADARQRIGLYIDYYNLQRPHQGIGGLVPADRFFFADDRSARGGAWPTMRGSGSAGPAQEAVLSAVRALKAAAASKKRFFQRHLGDITRVAEQQRRRAAFGSRQGRRETQPETSVLHVCSLAAGAAEAGTPAASDRGCAAVDRPSRDGSAGARGPWIEPTSTRRKAR